ncbi:unnamed protein product [Rotaria sp. Silwood1]|nr:unnamed protein product [Rotaria sp. Silwood1]CAF4902133.1 unnamed protein product [Rotaria sp. Silwood1]CAF5052172.1 unnamed protein product [Rotaria sp. Silwood1]
MSTFTTSSTPRNKSLLLSKGFSYIIDKITIDKTYWKCEHARKPKCKGRVHSNYINSILLNENDKHNHNVMKTILAVIDNCLTNLSDYGVARLPNFKHINL